MVRSIVGKRETRVEVVEGGDFDQRMGSLSLATIFSKLGSKNWGNSTLSTRGSSFLL